jgi:hypothetical protein
MFKFPFSTGAHTDRNGNPAQIIVSFFVFGLAVLALYSDHFPGRSRKAHLPLCAADVYIYLK